MGRHPGHHRPEAHGGEDAKQAFGTSPVKIVGVFEDGREERFPPYGRPRSARSGIPTFTRKSRVKARPTNEQFMVENAVRSGDQLVKDALRYMSNSPDFFGLFKILEVICWDLGKGDKEKGYRLIWQRGWVGNYPVYVPSGYPYISLLRADSRQHVRRILWPGWRKSATMGVLKSVEPTGFLAFAPAFAGTNWADVNRRIIQNCPHGRGRVLSCPCLVPALPA